MTRDQAITRRVLFTYWGRRGAMTPFMLRLAEACGDMPDLAATFSVSRQNESFDQFAPFGDRVLAIDTFARNAGALTQAWRIPAIRGQILQWIGDEEIEAVVDLMPHVWSAFILPAVRRKGVRYATITHDADAHPGDPTNVVNRVLELTMRRSDVVFTLSENVAMRLRQTGAAGDTRIATLFHPDLTFAPPPRRPPLVSGEPIRLLFLGRILAYKGLGLFVEAVERLRAEGVAVVAGIFGEGDLAGCDERLKALGAEVVNRWLTQKEISEALARYHVLVLSHIEASQSGVAAAGLGAGLPVIATPVGGLKEQVIDGENGLLAEEVDAGAIAAAIRRLGDNPQLYGKLCQKIEATREERSMRRFVERCVGALLP